MSPALHAAHLSVLNSQTRLPTAARLLVTAAVVVTRWDRHHRTRKALQHLDPHLLHDIGISRHQATTEARRWFWQT